MKEGLFEEIKELNQFNYADQKKKIIFAPKYA